METPRPQKWAGLASGSLMPTRARSTVAAPNRSLPDRTPLAPIGRYAGNAERQLRRKAAPAGDFLPTLRSLRRAILARVGDRSPNTHSPGTDRPGRSDARCRTDRGPAWRR